MSIVAAGDAALDDFPSEAFHVSVPAGARKCRVVRRLLAALGTGVAAKVALSGAGVATITRTWTLHRSRRTGLPVEHFGDVVSPGAFGWMLCGARSEAVRFLEWLRSRVSNLRGAGLRTPRAVKPSSSAAP